MDISFDSYKTFYYVAKYQNVTLAARALLCNQPNVTRVIKNLEYALGCTLFVRSNRGVRLTPEGQRLYARVKIAVEQIAFAETELDRAKTLQNGIVSLGATEIALHTFLLPVLKEYRGRYPGIRLNILNYTINQAVAALKNNLVDIAVVTTPTGDIKGLESKALKRVRETAVCGPYFSELAGRKISLETLAEYPLISLAAKTRTYEMYSKWFSENGLPYSPVIEVATADLILPMVQNNLGIGFVPEDFLGAGEGPDLYRIFLTEETPARFVTMLKRQDDVLSVAAKELVRLLGEAADSGLNRQTPGKNGKEISWNR